jgi:hypothetical protein
VVTVLMSQSSNWFVMVVTRVNVPIQSDEFIFLCFFFPIPMTSQGCNLIIFSIISMQHALSCTVY